MLVGDEQRGDNGRSPGNRLFLTTVALVLLTGLYPFPGRWKLLQQVIPIALIALFYYRSGYSLRRTGLARPSGGWGRCILLALAIAIPRYFYGATVRSRIAGLFFPAGKDLSLFQAMEGNLGNLILFLTFMWLLAAFGEEYIWRGFLLREIGERGEQKQALSWGLAVVASSAFFGLAHAYQGGYGVVEKFLGALELGTIYLLAGRSSIWLVVFIHGIQNTISFVAIYLGVYETLNFLAP